MNTEVYKALEYHKILKLLADHTVSSLGRELAERLEPMRHPAAVEAALAETTEARTIVERGAQVPLWGLADLRPLLERVEKGGVLQAQDLLRFADCLRGCRELKHYMQSKRQIARRLCAYAEGITPFKEVEDELALSIDGLRVADSASASLARVRKEIRILEERVKAKLQSYLTSTHYREALQEGFITIREGRYALPVKASHRSKLDGHVVGISSSGVTVFVEPTVVRKLVDELQALKGQEQAEEYQVLVGLTGLIAQEARPIRENLTIMGFFDLVFAKGRLSLSMKGVAAGAGKGGCIKLCSARHPLLQGEVIPLDLNLGGRRRTLVITGPNTGGKTVALKTVGLLALMTRAGLHVPAAEGTEFPVFERVLADIGDAQSIEQSLSTFSGHIQRIAGILRSAGSGCLVLLDEIGTGTDPAEGSALAMAILEELHAAGAVTIASTHYSDVKRLAYTQAGFVNGRMDFDRETLRPLFRLVMGEAGESQALWIASRLGIGDKVLGRARAHLTAAGKSGPGYGPAGPASGPGLPPATGFAEDAGKAQAAAQIPEVPVEDRDGKPRKNSRAWRLGDSVFMTASGQAGVIAELPDATGQLVVFSSGNRIRMHERRVRLLAPAEQLYPEGYDLRTVLFTWKQRKLLHDMQRKGDQVIRGSRSGEWVKTIRLDVDRSKREGKDDPQP